MRNQVFLLLVTLLMLMINIAAIAAPVAPADWKAMQQIQELLRSKSWMKADDIAPLLPVREKLTEFIQRYGGDQCSRIWSGRGSVPDEWKGMDLADESAVHAYEAARSALTSSARKTWPALYSTPLSELLAVTQAAIGVHTDDIDALRYAVGWMDGFMKQVAELQNDGRLYGYGIPGWYRQCRERLVQLEAQAGQSEITPVAFVDNTPISLSACDAQLYLRLVSLPIPLQLLRWDPEHKTAVFGDSRLTALTVAQLVAEVDGVLVTLSAPPRIEDGRLMISVRDVKPLFGLDYKWDPKLWAVRIFSPET